MLHITMNARLYPTHMGETWNLGLWGPGFGYSKTSGCGKGDGHDFRTSLYPLSGSGLSATSAILDNGSDLATLAILAVNQGMRL